MLTQNEEIAIFIGGLFSIINSKWGIGNAQSRPIKHTGKVFNAVFAQKHYTSDELQYDKSFDWLKPVIDKFMSIPPETFNYDNLNMTALRIHKENIKKLSIADNMNVIFLTVYNAVTFYNKAVDAYKTYEIV